MIGAFSNDFGKLPVHCQVVGRCFKIRRFGLQHRNQSANVQIAIEFLALRFGKQTRPRFCRQFIYALFVPGGQFYRKQIPGGFWGQFPLV